MKKKKHLYREKWLRFYTKLFKIKYIIIAALLLGLLIYMISILNNRAAFHLKNGTMVAESPLEIAVRKDKSTVINNEANYIMCIAPNGNLNYYISSKKDTQLTGMTLDNQDHLYLYMTENKPNGASKDKICEYNENGKMIRILYTIDYTGENHDSEQTVRTSPLHVENNILFFTRYLTYETQLYQINLQTGSVKRAETLKSTIPFLYNDVEGCSNGNYYYAKINGELGKGKIGGAQTVLYHGDYNIKGNKGFRPFYIRYVKNKIYTFDYWQGVIYEVKDNELHAPHWQGKFLGNINAYELSSSGNVLSGISNGIPWMIKGNTIIELPLQAKLSPLLFFKAMVYSALKICIKPFCALLILYILCGIIWCDLIRGRKIAWKILFYEILLTMGLALLLYTGVANRYQNYIKQNMNSLKERASLTAQLLSGENIAKINTSQDISTKAYTDLSDLLIKNYGLYESESDTAAVLLSPKAKKDAYIIVTSNRGYGDIMGESGPLTDLVNNAQDKNGSVYDQTTQKVIAYATVYDHANHKKGYICLYTTADNIRNEFVTLWSPYTLLGYACLLCLFFIVSTFLITRRLKKVTAGIHEISTGNFALHIPRRSRDELGSLIRCVNNLSKNINTLVLEKTELTEEVRKSQYEVLGTLAGIVENKSGQTAAHVKRVSECVRVLASHLGYSGVSLEYITIASMLHDVGKLFVPAEILEKPGKLTKEEFDIVKRHVIDGEVLFHTVPGPIMEYARNIAQEHHEKWDGTGYMFGLKGTDICLEARITAVADVFDALISKRPYKEPYTPELVYEMMVAESGHHFDPHVIEIFKIYFKELCRIVVENPDYSD